MFEQYSFMVTSCTASATSLSGGMIIRKHAHLNCKRIIHEFREDRKNVRIVIIDGCSFFSMAALENLDKN